MVVFENGKAKNSDYRKFKIKTVIGSNDFASMKEVITRRLLHYIKEKNGINSLLKNKSYDMFLKEFISFSQI